MSDLTSKVLCVNLRTSCLGTSFVDDYLTETLRVKTGAKEGKTKGSKKILGTGLAPIQKRLRALREYVKEVSLPGISPDLRIVTPKTLEEVRAEVAKAEAEIAEMVAAFSKEVNWTHPVTGDVLQLTLWQSLIEQDRVDLEKAFDEQDYPAFESLPNHFTVRLAICDMPAGDFLRVEGLTDDAIQRLKADHAAMLDGVKAAAKNEVHKKLCEMVQRIADNLAKDDISKLHATTFDNLHEYLAKVPDLNITGDPVLEQMRTEALAKLNYTMSQCKASAVLKEQAVEAAREFLDTFGHGTRRLVAPQPADQAA